MGQAGAPDLSRADANVGAGYLESARQGYLRASTYFRTAEFYLHGDPADSRILSESRASQKAYAEAANLAGPTWEPVEIPYEATTLPGYFYKVDNSGEPRPTLIFHGGFDSLTLMGMSMGGYLAARAAAFEHRVRAAVFFDGVYDLYASFRGLLPKEAVTALDAGDTVKCEEIIHKGMEINTSLRWAITQGIWSFGASSTADLLEKTKQATMEGVAEQIQCPCLVLEAEGDMFFVNQPKQLYDALQAPKTLFRFTSEDGAENHCQSGALAYLHEVVFNWLDETLKLRGGSEV